jgi:SAM-dependent methyltransferase
VKTAPNLSADCGAAEKRQSQEYWTALYRSAYADLDAGLDRESLLVLLDETEAMFRYRDHLAVVEMPLNDLAGKCVLEVGCGAGSHAALFARHGARMAALDLSQDRAAATQRKFDLLRQEDGGSAALQGDGERLPFADNSFDIVYSNGVLHHSPDTQAGVAELLRVLKPGGSAVVMLYCKHSINWWVTLWFGYGVLRGGLRRGVDRLGSATEWAGTDALTVKNPVTRAYTASELRSMFSGFCDLTLRKSDFNIVHLPKLGKLYHRLLTRRGREHPGGLLPYGAPWPIASKAELWIGRRLGWAWNIRAVKAPAPPE